MVFHSFAFILLFLPAVVGLNYALLSGGRSTARKRLLLLVSLVFYGLSSLETVPVLMGSLLLNHFVVGRIQSNRGAPRAFWLKLGIALNVGLLVLFKYTRLFLGTVGSIGGFHLDLPAFVLPLGISFFTIQQIIYLVDCYEEMVSPARLLDHALMISFFPTISAGPIVRAGALLPQFESSERPRDEQLATGLMMFAIGLCKKVVVADTFGRLSDAGFTAATPLGLIEGWLAAAYYTFQLYFDFSGYSDMALGIGLLLGLSLPVNFNSPLKAVSVIDFWKRWHITLSGFITTYLYTPIARSIRPLTFKKAMAVTVLSMAIAGLWHGAAWTFLAFGLLQGAGIVVNHLWSKTKRKLPKRVAWAFTLVFVLVSFVIFRADGWERVGSILSSMLGMQGVHDRGVFTGISRLDRAVASVIMMAAAAVALFGPNSNELASRFKPSWRWVAVCAAALVLSVVYLNTSATKGFIYRDF